MLRKNNTMPLLMAPLPTLLPLYSFLLQAPLLRLAHLVPDPQRTAFSLFSVFFEEAFDDRADGADGCGGHFGLGPWSDARLVATVAALGALATMCREAAASTVAKAVADGNRSSSSPSSLGASAVSSKGSSRHGTAEGAEGADEEEEDEYSSDGFYLKDLVAQQKREVALAAALEACVVGDGFLACYRDLIESLAMDEQVNSVPAPLLGS